MLSTGKLKKTNEDITFILQQQWFYKFLDGCTDETIRGTNLAEFIAFNGEKIEMNFLPRRNVVPTKRKFFLISPSHNLLITVIRLLILGYYRLERTLTWE